MQSVLGWMEESVILDAQDISKLEHYIDQKYIQSSDAIKAQILSDALQRVVDVHLEGLEKAYWKPLKQSLFQNVMLVQKIEISKKDIFTHIISLEDDETRLCEAAWHWAQINVWTQIAYDMVYDLAKALRFENFVESVGPLPELNEVPVKDVKRTKQQWLTLAMGIVILALGLWRWPYIDLKVRAFQQMQLEMLIAGDAASLENNRSRIKALEWPVVRAQPISLEKSKVKSNTSTAFVYSTFDEQALQKYLSNRHSLLAEAPYFQTIVQTAKAHNLDPRLLFAIAGQEQGLVNKNKSYAKTAANNPFNVFGSWKKYNTSIEDSSEIVCNTLIKRLARCPKGVNAFTWLNKTYASDLNWSKGVSRYYKQLCKLDQ